MIKGRGYPQIGHRWIQPDCELWHQFPPRKSIATANFTFLGQTENIALAPTDADVFVADLRIEYRQIGVGSTGRLFSFTWFQQVHTDIPGYFRGWTIIDNSSGDFYQAINDPQSPFDTQWLIAPDLLTWYAFTVVHRDPTFDADVFFNVGAVPYF